MWVCMGLTVAIGSCLDFGGRLVLHRSSDCCGRAERHHQCHLCVGRVFGGQTDREGPPKARPWRLLRQSTALRH